MLLGAAALTIAALAIWLRPHFRRARAYINDVSTCGHLAAPPTPRAFRWLQRLSHALVSMQVGEVDYIGRENLDSVDGPMIVTPNHPHWVDPCILALAINRPARFMAARGVFTFGWGLGALIAGPMGAFSVDLSKGKGGPARQAAVRVVVSGQVLGAFPEGWAYLDGVMGPLKKGVIHIAREASAILGKTTYITPIFIRYGRYPGSWIRKLPPTLAYLFVLVLRAYFRRGAIVVIGKPIPISEFPADDALAVELLRQRIVELDPQGKDGKP